MAFSDHDSHRVVPERYANPDTSGLGVEIMPGMEGFAPEPTSEKLLVIPANRAGSSRVRH